ncbi:hypothetical protein X766_33565 [Mesorhizobium sp. LSJC255A00]|uniref:hypothetical protein n=1 Tax=Mesorhizobium sp. LSJC255A00 TaxID=1287313 RepID=UPI0003CF73E9|nr:hypothetical protein [Mesorhizobium sp. LSJC255A00]ESX09469.1 hypothetical protein X766_33565 [Mesorhizobium sp. LSJC255A00]
MVEPLFEETLDRLGQNHRRMIHIEDLIEPESQQVGRAASRHFFGRIDRCLAASREQNSRITRTGTISIC